MFPDEQRKEKQTGTNQLEKNYAVFKENHDNLKRIIELCQVIHSIEEKCSQQKRRDEIKMNEMIDELLKEILDEMKKSGLNSEEYRRIRNEWNDRRIGVKKRRD